MMKREAGVNRLLFVLSFVSFRCRWGAVTRTVWLDMTAHYKLTPRRLLSPQLFLDSEVARSCSGETLRPLTLSVPPTLLLLQPPTLTLTLTLLLLLGEPIFAKQRLIRL